MTAPAASLASVLWRRHDGGADWCRLEATATSIGHRLSGVALLVEASAPVLATYTVTVDGSWYTTEAIVDVHLPDERHRRQVGSDRRGRWWIDGRRAHELDGCLDADVGFTPATNTLPIRRLGLAVGASADIVAAWIRFPDLEVVPAQQRYERIAEDRYRYTSRSFTAELQVGEDGLVRDYAGLWEAVAG